MILSVTNITLPLSSSSEEAVAAARREAGLPRDAVGHVSRRSVDARHGRVALVWSVRFELPDGTHYRAGANVREKTAIPIDYTTGRRRMSLRPVVVGSGPAGLLAALTLAEHGYRPLVIERGGTVSERDAAVERFLRTGVLDPDCNIQFGEGGAGTYSDGKLNTGVNDGYITEALALLARFGAGEEALIDARPHVGTDRLKGIVTALRERIVACGGEFLFHTRLLGLKTRDGRLAALRTTAGEIPAEVCILAVGHSARELYRELLAEGIPMERKLFSMGVRIEHLQSRIDEAMYGALAGHPALGPADYKVWDRSGRRGVYSFCMCPGGTVVAAASVPGGVVTNGMSDSRRSGRNANAALAVEVLPEDLDGRDPLAGVALQERFEREAFALGGGDYTAPAALLGDFLRGGVSERIGEVAPSYPRGVRFCALAPLLLPGGAEDLRNAIRGFGRRIRGFDAADAVLTAPETRTSAPVRILRGEDLTSPACAGLIPCGEGAGYAGGITSAGADGIRCALRILHEYAPLEELL